MKDVKKELEQDESQDKIDITKDKMMRVLKKMPNWKAPDLDSVQSYWLKLLNPLHYKLVVHWQKNEQCLHKRIRTRRILQAIIDLLHAYS